MEGIDFQNPLMLSFEGSNSNLAFFKQDGTLTTVRLAKTVYDLTSTKKDEEIAGKAQVFTGNQTCGVVKIDGVRCVYCLDTEGRMPVLECSDQTLVGANARMKKWKDSRFLSISGPSEVQVGITTDFRALGASFRFKDETPAEMYENISKKSPKPDPKSYTDTSNGTFFQLSDGTMYSYLTPDLAATHTGTWKFHAQFGEPIIGPLVFSNAFGSLFAGGGIEASTWDWGINETNGYSHIKQLIDWGIGVKEDGTLVGFVKRDSLFYTDNIQYVDSLSQLLLDAPPFASLISNMKSGEERQSTFSSLNKNSFIYRTKLGKIAIVHLNQAKDLSEGQKNLSNAFQRCESGVKEFISNPVFDAEKHPWAFVCENGAIETGGVLLNTKVPVQLKP